MTKLDKQVDEAIKAVEAAGISAAVTHTAGRTFAELINGADYVDGHALEKDKAALVGVPFVITGVTIRDGVLRGKNPTNYLSVELTTGDKAALDKAHNAGRMSNYQRDRIDPDEALIFNDGSTGIARQLVAYLHNKGLIIVPDGPDGGAMGECRWDTYRAQWRMPTGEHFPAPDAIHFNIRLVCLRGLRVSEYETDQSPDEANTFYIA